jgi:hypothetical protein
LQLLQVKDKDKTVEMKVISVREAEVINIITSLKSKNSPGFDEISSKILKSCANIISKLLTFIFNLSLASRIFPDRWKYAIAQPIYKKGDRTKITNYIPISLLISFSKILETLMFNRLNQYLKVNRILVQEPFGYRKGIFIEKAIFTLTDSIPTSLDHRIQTGVFFLSNLSF